MNEMNRQNRIHPQVSLSPPPRPNTKTPTDLGLIITNRIWIVIQSEAQMNLKEKMHASVANLFRNAPQGLVRNAFR